VFRNAVDQLMGYQATPILIVLAHCGALLWAAGFRKGIKPLLVVNLLLAAAIVVYNIGALGPAIAHNDYAIMSLAGFELITLLSSICAFAGIRVPSWIIWIGFGVNFLLAVALMAFVLSFKMTLLI
jgi:hypothetical protein